MTHIQQKVGTYQKRKTCLRMKNKVPWLWKRPFGKKENWKKVGWQKLLDWNVSTWNKQKSTESFAFERIQFWSFDAPETGYGYLSHPSLRGNSTRLEGHSTNPIKDKELDYIFWAWFRPFQCFGTYPRHHVPNTLHTQDPTLWKLLGVSAAVIYSCKVCKSIYINIPFGCHSCRKIPWNPNINGKWSFNQSISYNLVRTTWCSNSILLGFSNDLKTSKPNRPKQDAKACNKEALRLGTQAVTRGGKGLDLM